MPWLSLIPWKIVGVIAAILAMWGYGFYGGIQHQQKKQVVIDAKRAQAEADALQAAINDALKRSQLSFAVERKQLEAEQKVRTITKTLVRTIRDEKPDADCDLSNGWVLRHNEATTNTLPSAPGTDYADSSGVTADQALEQVAENYGICREIRQIAIGCQEWVTVQIGKK